MAEKYQQNTRRKVHVIRGNLANAGSNRNLIDVLSNLGDKLTIDLSNVAQYVEHPTDLVNGLNAFARASHGGNASIMATYQAENRGNPYSIFFAVGKDPTASEEQEKAGYIDWTYYYFPYLVHYNESITKKDLTVVEVNDDEMVPNLAGFLFGAFKKQKTRNFSNEIIITGFFNHVYLSMNDEFKEKIYKKTYEDFLVPELNARDLPQEMQNNYEKTLKNAFDAIAKNNLEYLVKTSKFKPGPLGFFLY